ncbi:SCO2521 family protein [Actinosynnema sp. NPDC020468]|uniref:SCO2521 family protein n=1 Tax=Actinosynnema sp. NPDC020468 TaxID=3154488 RepID=UPI0033EBF0F2
MVILGEVRTGLLHNSGPLPRQAVADLLALRPGSRTSSVDRPVARTTSPDLVSGVDCALATEPPRRARAIGTVATRAVVVGGVVVQSSARTALRWVTDRERRSWSHYAHRRGEVDVLGAAEPADVVRGGQRSESPRESLDLGSFSQRVLTLVQGRPQLDRRTALRTWPTRLRWSVTVGRQACPTAHLHVDSDMRRTADLVVPPELVGEALRFCEDLALHDWLYTALDNVVERVERDLAAGVDPIGLLRPALTLLVRLWMPGATVHPALWPLWEGFEESPGFSRTWTRNVAWVRDQVALRAVTAGRGTPPPSGRAGG